MPKKGENIYKRKDGRWEGRYIKARTSTGKIVYGYVYSKTYRETKIKLKEKSSNINRFTQPQTQLFATIASEWFESIKAYTKISTQNKYYNLLTLYILPQYGKQTFDAITYEFIESYCRFLLKSGGKKEQGLSSKTVNDVLSIIRNITKFASKKGIYVACDPSAIQVKQDSKPIRVLNIVEQKQLCTYILQNPDPCNIGILVCLFTGLRIGEICALRWEDISLSEQGMKCLMLEAQKERGEKTCGGYLTWSAISLLNQIGISTDYLIDNGAQKIEHLIQLWDKNFITHSHHCGEYGIGCKRLLLDNWLTECATNEGVQVEYGERVQSFSNLGDVFNVNNYCGKKLVFATGARGFVSKDSRIVLSEQSFGISAHIRGTGKINKKTIYFWYLDNLKNDYFWAIPIGGDVWNIGIWFQHLPEKKPQELFYEKANQYLFPEFFGYEYINKPHGAFCGNVNMTSFLPENCYGVGDFAGCNITTSGEGLRYAVQSAIQFSVSQTK